MCFMKCNKYLTYKYYTEGLRDFIREEKYPSGVMTSARNQPFCKKNLISTSVALMEGE